MPYDKEDRFWPIERDGRFENKEMCYNPPPDEEDEPPPPMPHGEEEE